jgi:hypothetical protein
VATYACNIATRRERIEGWLAPHMVRLFGMPRLASDYADLAASDETLKPFSTKHVRPTAPPGSA